MISNFYIDISIMTWVHNLQFILIIFGLLIITIFLPAKIETLIFLHRLGFGYLLLNLWLVTLDRSFSVEESLHVSFQENPFFSHLFFLYVTAIVIAFFYGILDRIFIQNGDETEFALLVCFIAMGTFFLFYLHNLIEFLLAIETVTLATYVCIGYERQKAQSSYASIQYFVLGSIPSGILILGLSLLYSYAGVLTFEDLDLFLYETGTFQNNLSFGFNYLLTEGQKLIVLSSKDWDVLYISDAMNNILIEPSNFFEEKTILLEEIISPRSSTLIVALLFILFNLLFKLTAAPFHFWAPSVYKYAPISSVTYLSIISKAMVVFLLFKICLTIFYSFIILVSPILFFCAILSVMIGFIGAFVERTIKAFYVYSSMGHVGFMLVGFALFTTSGLNATFHYLIIYIISSFIMWFILLHLGQSTRFLISFKELKKSNLTLALIFALLVFSMSGLPPLGGFFIKLDILAALLESSRFGLNMILFFFTVASFFYYLRINKIIFFDEMKTFVKHKEQNIQRFQLLIILLLVLLFYVLIVETSLFVIQSEMLTALSN